MRAAERVGHAARPLPLFYALSQAGRAIAAAHLDDPAWRLAGHGLRTDPKDAASDVLRRVIVPAAATTTKLATGRRDSFGGVAAAVGSGTLTVKRIERWASCGLRSRN